MSAPVPRPPDTAASVGKRALRLGWAVLASGLPLDHDLEALRKVILVNLISLVGGGFLAVLGVLAGLQAHYLLCGADFAILAFLCALYAYQWRTRDHQRSSLVGTLVTGGFFLFLFYTGGVNLTAFVWYYTFPLVALFLLGTRLGSLLSLGLLLPTLVALVFAPHLPGMAQYPLDLLLRFFPSYLVVLVFAYVMERVREVIQERLQESAQELGDVVERLQEAKAVLENLATQDGLTGLYNRRHFDEVAPVLLAQSQRQGARAAMLMLDLDHFKQYNDHYGHLAGDDALRAAASVITGVVRRRTDLAFRYGGEEFAILLVPTDEETPIRVAMDIVESLRARSIEHMAGSGTLTVSVGVAYSEPGGEQSLEELVSLADRALYDAKDRGRDQWSTWQPPPGESR